MAPLTSLLLGIFALALTRPSLFALATTNTNQCITDLGGIQVCQDRNAIGIPKQLQGCCDGIRQLVVDSCECNPAIDVLLGEGGTKIYDLEPLCRLVQPLKWLKIKLRHLRNCISVQSSEYGCPVNDLQMDAARLGSILKFSGVFAATTSAACLDVHLLSQQLSQSLNHDASMTIPYGIGTYNGLADITEYLGMAFSSLTHEFWHHNTNPDPTKRARLEVSADGSTWISGGTMMGDFLRGALPYQDVYFEQSYDYAGCDTKILKFLAFPGEGIKSWIERYVQAADLSKRWGLEDICRYHTKFCATDPSTKQYESEAECLGYLGALPLYTQACGPNRPMGGHSISCKFKHHFMVPINPQLHCPHIGPLGRVDPNGHFKCDDAYECNTDEGQSSWPAVQKIGPNTPADVVKVFEDSNVGYQNEPFGCIV
jgi:hypothetical protein